MNSFWYGMLDVYGQPIAGVPIGESHRYEVRVEIDGHDKNMACWIRHIVPVSSNPRALYAASFAVQFDTDAPKTEAWVSAYDFGMAIVRDTTNGSAGAAMAEQVGAAAAASRSSRTDPPCTRGGFVTTFQKWCGAEGSVALNFGSTEDDAPVDHRTLDLTALLSAHRDVRLAQFNALSASVKDAVREDAGDWTPPPKCTVRQAKRRKKTDSAARSNARSALHDFEATRTDSSAYDSALLAVVLAAAQVHDDRVRDALQAVRIGSVDDDLDAALKTFAAASLNANPDADASKLHAPAAAGDIEIDPFKRLGTQVRDIDVSEVDKVRVVKHVREHILRHVDDVDVQHVDSSRRRNDVCECMCRREETVDAFNVRVDDSAARVDRVKAALATGSVQSGSKRFISTDAHGRRRVEVTMLSGDCLRSSELGGSRRAHGGGGGSGGGGSGGGGAAGDADEAAADKAEANNAMIALQAMRRAFTTKTRSGQDHANNGHAMYMGQHLLFDDVAAQRGLPAARRGGDYWFVPRLLPVLAEGALRCATDEEARRGFKLAVQRTRRETTAALDYAERLQTMLEPQLCVVRRSVMAIDHPCLSGAGAFHIDHTTRMTNGAGIITDFFSGTGHFDPCDNALSTMCVARVHGQVAPQTRVGGDHVQLWDARAATVRGGSSVVRMPLPPAFDGDGGDVDVAVHASMSFFDLAVGGEVLRTALTDGCATMWSGKYLRHATNVPFARSGSYEWVLRAPPCATWDAAELTERAVVSAWGGYNSTDSIGKRVRARARRRAALAPCAR